MKRAFTVLCSFVSILCLCYYASKYYFDGSLFISSKNIWFFTIIISFTLFGLVLGVINCYRVDKLKEQNIKLIEQNVELIKKLSDLSDKVDSYHYSEMKSIHSNMEVILDGGEE